jgi:hypothetical protein
MGKLMIEQPLNSIEQFKVMIFCFLLLPAIGVVVGVIPALLLTYGLYMMKRSRKFSHVEISAKVAKGYFFILLVATTAISLFALLFTSSKVSLEDLLAASLFILTPILYIIFIDKLFLDPLSSHKKWVEVNDIFSHEPKPTNDKYEQSDKGDAHFPYSIADELLKLAKLKEGGMITETEFSEAKSKILK